MPSQEQLPILARSLGELVCTGDRDYFLCMKISIDSPSSPHAGEGGVTLEVPAPKAA